METVPERASGADAAGAPGIEGYQDVLRSAEAALGDVERALAALDEGSYGVCALCGQPIPDEQLESDPTVLRCVAHATS